MDSVENCPICTARLRTMITSNDSMTGRVCSMRAVVRINIAVRYEIGDERNVLCTPRRWV
jgi:hypothetical protein